MQQVAQIACVGAFVGNRQFHQNVLSGLQLLASGRLPLGRPAKPELTSDFLLERRGTIAI
jgi:hypothetical protein